MAVGPVAAADDRARSDDELVAAICGGDLSALGSLYDRHGSLAYSVALRMTGDPRWAEAAVESAFLSLWSDRARQDTETDPVRVRLIKGVARAALAIIRRQRPKRSPELVEPPQVPDAAVNSPLVARPPEPEVPLRVAIVDVGTYGQSRGNA